MEVQVSKCSSGEGANCRLLWRSSHCFHSGQQRACRAGRGRSPAAERSCSHQGCLHPSTLPSLVPALQLAAWLLLAAVWQPLLQEAWLLQAAA
jgi:hypothetical protein